MHTHVHVHGWAWRVFLWRRETDGGCLLLLSTLLLKTESLTGPGALWFGKTTWPPSSREPPVCLSRSKTSVMHDCTAPFTRTLGIWTRVLVFTQSIRRVISLALQSAPLIWAQEQGLSNLWLTSSPPVIHAKRLSVWLGLSLMTGFDFWVARQKYIENSKSIDPGPRVKTRWVRKGKGL